MRTRMILAVAVMIFVVLDVSQAQVKKYDIKSGIVTYDLLMKVVGMEMKKKVVVYFDDYGMKECKETYGGNKLEDAFLSDGKELYSLNPSQKKAFKRGPSYRGTELRVEWSELGSQKDRDSGKVKKMPDMTIAGKKCEVFQTNDGKGSITQFGGWNKIMMLLDVKQKSVTSVQKAVKVEENAKVPSEKFSVPAGYTIE